MRKIDIENTLYFLLDKVEDCYKEERETIVNDLLKQIKNWSLLMVKFKNKFLSFDNRVSLSKNYILSVKRIRLIKLLIIFITFIPFLTIMIWLNFNVISIVILMMYIYIAWKLKMPSSINI